MNVLYILIPIVIISLGALILIRPKLQVLNKKHTRYIKPDKSGFNWNNPVNEKTDVNIENHPPIVQSGKIWTKTGYTSIKDF